MGAECPPLGVVFFVVILLLVIVIHEGGHFTFAKLFGIKVEEFFLGFGPRLWSFRQGETEYGVKAIPLGGYVRIAGMNPFEETAAGGASPGRTGQAGWQRFLVILAGPITHFVMAFLVLGDLLRAAVGTAEVHAGRRSGRAHADGAPGRGTVAGVRRGAAVRRRDRRRRGAVKSS